MRQDRFLSEHVAAIRCASEGMNLATLPGNRHKGEIYMVHDVWSKDNKLMLKAVAEDLRSLADAIEKTGDVSYAFACASCAGVAIDRITKYTLMTSPGLETDCNYTRARDGIKKYGPDGKVIEIIDYQPMN